MNWQVIGQLVAALLIIGSGPLVILLSKKSDL
uniref:Photosystem II reaction center protein Ycf12 n=1 Tax=Desmarestia aculeata TaxID=62298 RepID=A0A8F0FAN4_9PHAE|nr:hypothetical protein V2483_pgp098 [Desmarestia aculeata]QWK43705.1 hypothetical protein [Desmarestia aculeata]WAM62878.1 hypothetical protein [Desmarestia aculeata]